MSKTDITVYGAHWCRDCRRSKQFLGEHQIPYNWVDIEEDPKAEQFVLEKNDGKRIIPTIVFSDETFLVEPTNAEGILQMDGALIFIGLVPNTGFLEGSDILLDRWGSIVTGHALLQKDHRPIGFEHRDPLLLETSLPGFFAAGDVRDTSTKQVVSAAGKGSTAALMVCEYLKGV